jgi:hypothetical protein
MVPVLTCPTSYARSGYASRICRTKVLKAFGPTMGLLGIQIASCRNSRANKITSKLFGNRHISVHIVLI